MEKAYRRKCTLQLLVIKSASNCTHLSIQKAPKR